MDEVVVDGLGASQAEQALASLVPGATMTARIRVTNTEGYQSAGEATDSWQQLYEPPSAVAAPTYGEVSFQGYTLRYSTSTVQWTWNTPATKDNGNPAKLGLQQDVLDFECVTAGASS